ncbi:hypothetical protein BC835DRAFT_1422841 [Cytidiella melzeri]|nr:hypothetical protein BC835DRAFT_1422841 [Cytidiella melzeri]
MSPYTDEDEDMGAEHHRRLMLPGARSDFHLPLDRDASKSFAPSGSLHAGNGSGPIISRLVTFLHAESYVFTNTSDRQMISNVHIRCPNNLIIGLDRWPISCPLTSSNNIVRKTIDDLLEALLRSETHEVDDIPRPVSQS